MHNVTLSRVRAMSIIEPVWVFVALGIQHAVRMRHIVMCGLSRCTVFFHVCLKRHDSRVKKKLSNKKCVFCFLYNFCLKHFSFEKEFSEI